MTEHAITRKDYYVVFILLMVLLLLTFGAHLLHLGLWGFVISMAIALAKVVLIMLYFMHLRLTKGLPWVMVTAGIVWFVLLIGGTLGDVLSRYWILSGRS